MNGMIRFDTLLSKSASDVSSQLTIFAVVNLGVVESISSGLMTPSEAIHTIYHYDNCVYVDHVLKDKTADEIMSRGVQLSDLFDVLPPEKANRALRHELEKIRSLCLKLLEKERLAA